MENLDTNMERKSVARDTATQKTIIEAMVNLESRLDDLNLLTPLYSDLRVELQESSLLRFNDDLYRDTVHEVQKIEREVQAAVKLFQPTELNANTSYGEKFQQLREEGLSTLTVDLPRKTAAGDLVKNLRWLSANMEVLAWLRDEISARFAA